ncbi:MAG TPA: hypothetical protein VGP38_10370 [Rubrobacter sp.]|jgi:hypothetical protein|nr:hypothetical protein [Rubrobacter sp.]
MSDRRIPPAPDRGQASFTGVRRLTEAELAESIHADEIKLGRPHTPSERMGFTRGFFGQEYAEEIRRLMALGVEEPGGDEDEG